MGDIIDKSHRFVQSSGFETEHEWAVTIEVNVTLEFLRKALYCWRTGKVLVIQHTFTKNPLRRSP